MLILGIGNKARNGKDTAAEAIRDHYERENRLRREHGLLRGPGTQVGTFKFATELYREVEDFIWYYGDGSAEKALTRKYGLPIPMGDLIPAVNTWESGPLPAFETVKIPDWVTPGDPTPAPMAKYGKHPKLLQWWGTEYRRQYFGTNYWVDKLFASIPANLDIAIVSDTRFPNEADGVKQRGGYTINVQRLREDGTQYYSSDRPVDHPSETALDDYNWDFYLKIPAGHAALNGELAVTLAEYLRGLKR